MRVLAFAFALAAPWAEAAAAPAPEEPLQPKERRAATLKSTDPVLQGHGPSRTFSIGIRMQGRFSASVESHDFDAFVRVETTKGELVAESDGGGIELDAAVSFDAVPEKAYRIVAAASDGASRGGAMRVSFQPGEPAMPAGTNALAARAAWRALAAERAAERRDREAAAFHRAVEGDLRRGLGDLDGAEKAYASARDLYDALRDRSSQARMRGKLGSIQWSRKDLAKARAEFGAMLDLGTESRDALVQASALNALGAVSLELAEHGSALGYFDRALPLARALPDERLVAEIQARAGLAHVAQKEWALASKRFDEAIPAAKRAGSAFVEELATGGAGEVALAALDYRRALTLFRRQLTLSRTSGSPGGQKRARERIRHVEDTMERLGLVDDAPEAREDAGDVAELPPRPEPRAATEGDLPAAREAVAGVGAFTRLSVAVEEGELVLVLKLEREDHRANAAFSDAARGALLLYGALDWLGALRVRIVSAGGATLESSTVTPERALPFLRKLDDPFESRRIAEWWGQMRS